MRTAILRSAFLLATVFTLHYTRAAGPEGSATTTSERAMRERTLDRQLNRYLSFPLLERSNMLGEVMIAFVINTEGRVEVIACESANEQLKQYVLRKLAKVDIGENPDGIWKTTYLRLVFKPEQV